MRIFKLNCFLVLVLVAVAGCSQQSKENEAAPSQALQPKSAHGEGMPASVPDSGLKFTAPAGWVAEAPSSTSRRAQYKLARVEGDSEDAQLVVYYFGGGGGSPEANVDRWVGEFRGPDGKSDPNPPKVDHRTVNGMHLTVVDVRGTYSSSMGSMTQENRPKSGIRLLGAIAETQSGPWFVKLIGPEKTVARWEPSFQSFLQSMKQGD